MSLTMTYEQNEHIRTSQTAPFDLRQRLLLRTIYTIPCKTDVDCIERRITQEKGTYMTFPNNFIRISQVIRMHISAGY